ncbi:MAG TPA: ABC transporter permease [Dongiaceae bacterium]
MLGLIGRRLVFSAVALILASVLIFAVTDWLPPDLVDRILGQQATPENVATVRAELRLDQPPYQRYLAWVQNGIRGDFGHSLRNGRAVADVIGPRLWNTLFLVLSAAVAAIPLAVVLGVLAAIGRNGVFDKLMGIITVAAVSMPEFLIGYLLMLYLAVQFRWFPVIVTYKPEQTMAEHLHVMFLPILTLLVVVLAHMVRAIRSAVAPIMTSPYLEMATLKGLSTRRIVTHHVLPNAWPPIINIAAVHVGYLVVGVVVVEAAFTYNGLGRLMVDAVSRRDVPVVQASGLVFAIIFIGLNLVADVLSILGNPRLRHPR